MGRVLFDLSEQKKEQKVGSVGVMTLNLNNVKTPEPTIKMILVLRNLYDYGFISLKDHNEAVHDFFKASALIEAHQQDMHAHVGEIVSTYKSYSRSGGGGYSHEWTEMDDIGCECGLFW